MDRLALSNRVRAVARDFSGATFRDQDVFEFLNEAIDRCKQVIPHLAGMTYLMQNTDVPKRLPLEYHHLLAVYAGARLYFQDDRHFQGSTLMNEFETKLDQLLASIQGGETKIYDEQVPPQEVIIEMNPDYVTDNYFFKKKGGGNFDPDSGVEGVTY